MCNYRVVMATLQFLLLLALSSEGGMKDRGNIHSTNPICVQVRESGCREAKGGRIHGWASLFCSRTILPPRISSIPLHPHLLFWVPTSQQMQVWCLNSGRQVASYLGKASLSEWAEFRALHAPSGWCARSGQTKNPYVLSADPCGSSSGSAVGVAANMVAVSLGTETYGSILCPSGANSVVGIKPHCGSHTQCWSHSYITHTQDTVGPICRSVTDAVYLLDEIVGYDIHDPEATKTAAQLIPKGGYKQFLKPFGLQSKRLGLARQPGLSPSSPEAVFLEKHLATMRRKGATSVENNIFGNLSKMYYPIMDIVLAYDFKHDLNIYLSELLQSPVRTLADIISFNIKHAKEEELWKYGQEIFLQAQNTSGLNAEPYKRALKGYAILRKYVNEEVFQKYKLDALVSLDPLIYGVLGAAGYPGMTLPARYKTTGEAVGIYFGGTRGSEPTLVEIGYAFEQATKLRNIPSFKTSSSNPNST